MFRMHSKWVFLCAMMSLLTIVPSFSQSEISETTSSNSAINEINPRLPVMTFDVQNIDLGDVEQGVKVPMIYQFTNTGNGPLFIEVVTSCKCSEIEWSSGIINPGEVGEIHVIFDSTEYEGIVEKVVDIVANTDPIVVEAWFRANVIKKSH